MFSASSTTISRFASERRGIFIGHMESTVKYVEQRMLERLEEANKRQRLQQQAMFDRSWKGIEAEREQLQLQREELEACRRKLDLSNLSPAKSDVPHLTSPGTVHADIWDRNHHGRVFDDFNEMHGDVATSGVTDGVESDGEKGREKDCYAPLSGLSKTISGQSVAMSNHNADERGDPRNETLKHESSVAPAAVSVTVPVAQRWEAALLPMRDYSQISLCNISPANVCREYHQERPVAASLMPDAFWITVWPGFHRFARSSRVLVHSHDVYLQTVIERAAKQCECQPAPQLLFTPRGKPIRDVAQLVRNGHYLVYPSGSKYKETTIPTLLLLQLAEEGRTALALGGTGAKYDSIVL